MASLGYKSLENPLITTKQTRPPPFLYKTSELPPVFFFFFVRLLLPLLRSCDFRRPQAGRRHPPHKSIIFLSFPSSSSPKTIFYLTPSRLLSPLVLHHFRRVPWLRRPRQRQTRDKVSLAISLLHALLSNFDFPLLRSLLCSVVFFGFSGGCSGGWHGKGKSLPFLSSLKLLVSFQSRFSHSSFSFGFLF